MSNAHIQHFLDIRNFSDYLTTIVPPSWFTKVCIHHTYIPNTKTWAGKRTMDSMLKFYKEQKKWDRYPHIFVAPDGIWTMNKLNEKGIHANVANKFSIGVEVVGYYDYEVWQNPIRRLAIGTIYELIKWGNLRLEDYIFHREYNRKKTCPGKMITREFITPLLEIYNNTNGHEGYTQYKVMYTAPIFQGPALTYPIAGTIEKNEIFFSAAIKTDEQQWSINDNTQWVHLTRHSKKAGLGFVHTEFLIKEK